MRVKLLLIHKWWLCISLYVSLKGVQVVPLSQLLTTVVTRLPPSLPWEQYHCLSEKCRYLRSSDYSSLCWKWLPDDPYKPILESESVSASPAMSRPSEWLFPFLASLLPLTRSFSSMLPQPTHSVFSTFLFLFCVPSRGNLFFLLSIVVGFFLKESANCQWTHRVIKELNYLLHRVPSYVCFFPILETNLSCDE